jgi:hypothetical protein
VDTENNSDFDRQIVFLANIVMVDLFMRPCHGNRVWSVRYNQFHDQLVLTSSSDSRVVLNNLTSISSEPLGRVLIDGSDDEGDKEDTDR